MDNDYQLYIQNTIALASSIVIKSEDSADNLNQYVISQTAIGVDPDTGQLLSNSFNPVDPTTWKYYLNISGEYHPIDTMMTVVSLDDLQTINFTKENLEIHIATKAGYAYGTNNYEALVARYPNQEMLIRGILYPVDINTAINVPNGQILTYPPNLVEANEYSLIQNLQAFINGFIIRWVNQQYGISDNLYPATWLGILYLLLVMEIINLRLEAAKTNEAHSYHVKQYLASHGHLDKYIPYMTLEQKLFFYRNIAYIERNVGKQTTFAWLVENILTNRSLPLSEYNMVQDISQMPANLYPSITFIKSDLNEASNTSPGVELDINSMLTLEAPLAPDNATYQADYLPYIQEIMQDSRSNLLPTKVLQSDVIDYTNSSPYNLEDILIDHWLYLSNLGLYTAAVGIENPVTGGSIILSAADAYTFAWYLFCGSVGIDLAVIPQVYARRVQILTPPTQQTGTGANTNSTLTAWNNAQVSDLLALVDQKYIDPSLATEMLSVQPAIGPIISTETFYTTCQSIFKAANIQLGLVSEQEHFLSRAMAQNMSERIYSDQICTLAPAGTTYTEWFGARNMVLGTLTPAQMGSMYLDLVGQATGIALNPTTSLGDLQKAMISMLAQLSSYSIQFLTTINTTSILQTNGTVVRTGDIDGQSSDYFQDPDLAMSIIETDVTSKLEMSFDLNETGIVEPIKVFERSSLAIDFGAKILEKFDLAVYPMNLNILPLRVYSTLPLPTTPPGIISVPGIDNYLSLTQEQQMSLKDIYTNISFLPPDPLPTNVVPEDPSTFYITDRYVQPQYFDTTD